MMNSRLGRRMTSAQRTDMWRQWRQGETVCDIARTLEFSHSAVGFAIRQLYQLQTTIMRHDRKASLMNKVIDLITSALMVKNNGVHPGSVVGATMMSP